MSCDHLVGIQGETVSVNQEPLAELFDADSSIVCVSAISVQHLEPNGGIVIAAGCADGSFCVWNLHGDGGMLVHPDNRLSPSKLLISPLLVAVVFAQ